MNAEQDTNSMESEDRVAIEVAPESKSESRRGGMLKRIAIGLVVVVVLMAVGYVIFDKQFRPQVDQNLSNVDLEQTDSPTEDRRGSCTDLFLTNPVEEAEATIDPALLVARECLKYFQKEVVDYTAVMISQERVRGKLAVEEFNEVKIRNPRKIGDADVPLSVYMKFLKPRKSAGREVIWVDGWNQGKLIAHEGGLLNLVRVALKPTGKIAMNGKRYPITRIGIENLLVRIIEVAELERDYGECELKIDRSYKINGHKATVIEMIHPVRREHFHYHIAKIYIDDELNMPVGYEGYMWPKEEGGEAVLVERYFYNDIKLNVGLTDADFDPDNEAYDFP